jgi:hypothetical protein
MATFVGDTLLLIAFIVVAVTFTVFNQSIASFFGRRFLQTIGWGKSEQEQYVTVVHRVLLYIGSLFCAALAIFFVVALLFGHQGQRIR